MYLCPQVFDAVAQLADLAAAPDERAARGKALRQAPRQGHAHSAEGFALDWSRVIAGRLASGDCAGRIYAREPTDKGSWLVGSAHEVPRCNVVCDFENPPPRV